MQKKLVPLLAVIMLVPAASHAITLAEGLTISGSVEFEASYEKSAIDGEGEQESDLFSVSAEIETQVLINEYLSAGLVFSYEDGESHALEIDEALIEYSRGGYTAIFGRQCVPFGAYPSHLISDPLTVELGETKETALLVGYGSDVWGASAFVFNGDVDKQGDDDHIDDWGAALYLKPCGFFEMGASYQSDLADTDAELVEEYTDEVGGWSAYLVARFGPVEVSGESMGAVSAFDVSDLDEDEDGSGDRPMAWNIEAAVSFPGNMACAARLEGSSDFSGRPERQYGACLSWGPWERVTLSLEYLRGRYDDRGGDEDDSRDVVTSLLAIEF